MLVILFQEGCSFKGDPCEELALIVLDKPSSNFRALLGVELETTPGVVLAGYNPEGFVIFLGDSLKNLEGVLGKAFQGKILFSGWI